MRAELRQPSDGQGGAVLSRVGRLCACEVERRRVPQGPQGRAVVGRRYSCKPGFVCRTRMRIRTRIRTRTGVRMTGDEDDADFLCSKKSCATRQKSPDRLKRLIS